jgi:hypothetical protein
VVEIRYQIINLNTGSALHSSEFVTWFGCIFQPNAIFWLYVFYYVRAVSETKPKTMPKAGTKKGDGVAPHGTETEKKSLEDGDEDEAVSLR